MKEYWCLLVGGQWLRNQIQLLPISGGKYVTYNLDDLELVRTHTDQGNQILKLFRYNKEEIGIWFTLEQCCQYSDYFPELDSDQDSDQD